MSALLTLAKSLGIDPWSLNQADLQEQTCGRAIEGINTLKTEVKMLQNVTNSHQQYIYELAAKVERLRCVLTRMVNEKAVSGAFYHKVHDELFDLAESALSETPPAALAALKAQWQAEAVQSILDECEHWRLMGTGTWGILVDDISEKLEGLYQRAKEAGDE